MIVHLMVDVVMEVEGESLPEDVKQWVNWDEAGKAYGEAAKARGEAIL